ncbi:MAG: magnesium transporter [Candidatus Omnitrophica bacterium]|nr:magnesium transporter [Candidatus Omnitrophota bacterium]
MTSAINRPPQLESVISQDYVAVSDRGTVGTTIQVLRERKKDFQNRFAYVYVTDQERKLVGVLRIRDLLIEDRATPIERLMTRSVVRLVETMSLEDAIRMFRNYLFRAIPVTDGQDRLVGVVPLKTVERYLGLLPRSIFPQFAGFGLEEIEGKGIRDIVLKRLPWFLISVASSLVCAYVLGLFIGEIESIIALVLFVPIILGFAGSVGTQSAAVTVRGLKEGRIEITRLFKILLKEAAVGISIAGIAFILASLIALLWRKSPVEGIALSLSIVSVVIVSGLLGFVLPIVFRTLRINSNFVSRLFVLLICDIVALILYFIVSFSFVTPMLELR